MSLLAAASRVFLASLAGGAGYVSVRAGVWSDGRDSREKLEAMKKKVSELRGEISYPSTEPKTKVSKEVQQQFSKNTSSLGSSLSDSLVKGWNTVVKSVACFLSSSSSPGISSSVHSLLNRLKEGWNK